EKLDEVVAAIDSKRVDLAKLQDRFRYRVDLAPSDIREVATKRVLAKKDGAIPVLKKLFADNQGTLLSALKLERTARRSEVAEDQGWASRVAKVICLLEFLRDLPRTETNVAAFLVDGVGRQAPLAQVKAAVKRLQAAQFVRNTEEGWKLQTAQEKNWETKRQG